jgi:hypothetical protein
MSLQRPASITLFRLRLQAIRAILTRLRSKVENAVRRRNQILQDAKDAAEQAAYEEAQ